MKWQKLGLKMLHAPEEGQHESFHKHLQASRKWQVTAFRKSWAGIDNLIVLVGDRPHLQKLLSGGSWQVRALGAGSIEWKGQ